MAKKILLVLAIIIVLFAGINTAAALSPSILDAISGLPLSDQIIFIAKEVDRLKLKDVLRDACDEAKGFLNPDGRVTIGSYTFHSFEQAVSFIDPQNGYLIGGTPGQVVLERKAKYDQAKADCDRLTEEFNQKYGE